MNLLPDYGLFLLRWGIKQDVPQFFYDVPIDQISRIDNQTFTTSVANMHAGIDYMMSIDFSLPQLLQLLTTLPMPAQEKIREWITTSLTASRTLVLPCVIIAAQMEMTLGTLQTGSHDQFVPFVVRSFC